MAEQRSPIVALIMWVIPFVNLYLFYKWWQEVKATWGLEENPLVMTILLMIPIIGLYPLYKIIEVIDSQLKVAGKPGFPLGPVGFIIAWIIGFMLLIIPGLIISLYFPYKLQECLNELDVQSL